ncbi:MAG: cytochrome c biogenesis protein CcsA [Candidatus Thalassarchaeaceae archaeon]|nr:cytochrome c biogenesis protein CcsA [Candidatus Thalassarchaeaceae archaeon]
MHKFVGIALMIPFTLLLLLFIFDVSTFEYVWLHSSPDIPLIYKISALWAGRAGPILLWVALLGALLFIDGDRHTSESEEQHKLRIRLIMAFSVSLFLVAMLLEPFRFTPDSNSNRPGLNAFLQTELMVIHPPMVFLFYTLCVGVGAHSIAAMLVPGKPARDRILHLARPAFFVGTLGVGLGGLWAYTVLDWGGYWAWDPVETGSLLPWLALILLLHFRLPKGMAKEDHWYIGLGILPAFFSIHATLVTRANGVWQSIHAFVADKDATTNSGPIQRILDIGVSSSEGIEVHIYLIILAGLMWLLVRHFAKEKDKKIAPLSMIIGGILGLYIGSLEVGLLTGIFFFLLCSHGNSNERSVWIISGISLMLFSRWAFLISMEYALIGTIVFILPWLLSKEIEEIPLNWTETRWQQRLVLWIPLAIGGPFLLLTWLILIQEVEGTTLASHEMYGLPLLCFASLGLTVYAWKKVVSSEKIPWVLGIVICSSILFAVYWPNSLPGNSDYILQGNITRGMLAGFALPLLLFSTPPLIRLVWIRFSQIDGNPTPVNIRRLAMHVAHLGIVLLLIGHVFTTTLVQRGDPSHVAVLPKDVAIEHGGYWYTFSSLTSSEPGDQNWDSDVGDGLIEIEIEIRESAEGPVVAILTPGMLRFDEGGIPARSETDVWHRLQGDLIVIFDINQANQLSLVSFMKSGEEVDSVRVTIYDLTGSHLVWTGWVLILIGTALNWILAPSPNLDEEE